MGKIEQLLDSVIKKVPIPSQIEERPKSNLLLSQKFLMDEKKNHEEEYNEILQELMNMRKKIESRRFLSQKTQQNIWAMFKNGEQEV